MPELNGRPLLDTRPDQALYVARPREEEVVLSALGRDLNVLVSGDRGAGKTSFMRHLAHRLRAEGRPVAFVEGGATADLESFLELVRFRLDLPPPPARPALAYEGASEAGPRRPRLLELVHGLADHDREDSVLLVDELSSPEDAHTLFGRLRDELWQLPFTWVVAAPATHASTYLTPPADAFFDVVVELEPLDVAQQRELLARRLGDESGAVDELVEDAGRSPRELLSLVREVVTRGRRPAELLAARAERERRAAALGRPAIMLVSELDALGPVSASDERLLRRLGWSRARAVQVLKQLEAAGLVHAATRPGPNGGRPRTVYELGDPSAPAAGEGGAAR